MSSLFWPSQPRPISTPCIGVCTLDHTDICEGCLRHATEISRWSAMSEAERQHVMLIVLPAREAERHV